MTTIAIKLNPGKMENPDADIRYTIPDLIQEATDNCVTGDGYDYLDDDSMVIFLKTEDSEMIKQVVEVLDREVICGNKVLDTAVISVDSGTGYSVIHPREDNEKTKGPGLDL